MSKMHQIASFPYKKRIFFWEWHNISPVPTCTGMATPPPNPSLCPQRQNEKLAPMFEAVRCLGHSRLFYSCMQDFATEVQSFASLPLLPHPLPISFHSTLAILSPLLVCSLNPDWAYEGVL